MGTILRAVQDDSLVGDKADEPFVNRSSLIRGDQPAPDSGLVADHDQAQVGGGKMPQGGCSSVHQPDPVRLAWKADVLDQGSVAIQEDRRLEGGHEP